MRAAICTRYGPPEVQRIEEVDKPVPRRGEVLVRVHASSVNSSDWFVRSGLASGSLVLRAMLRLAVGFRGPRRRILGMVVAGEVEAVGRAVTRFGVGDRVLAFTMLHFGGYAQYTCLRETSAIGRAPSNLTFEQGAAIVYGGLLALHYLQRAGLRSGQRVLVYGASGGVGAMAVQLARHFGADVTGVCSGANLDLVRSLGAHRVLDYTTETTTPTGAAYDLVLDAVGERKTSPFKVACRGALAPGGKYVSVDDGSPKLSAGGLEILTGLAEQGAIGAVIDRTFPLEEISAAHRYVEQEHKKGSVVVTVG
jgi:NADPH:quinone reductase-like Zn-dependent oxidoreductase